MFHAVVTTEKGLTRLLGPVLAIHYAFDVEEDVQSALNRRPELTFVGTEECDCENIISWTATIPFRMTLAERSKLKAEVASIPRTPRTIAPTFVWSGERQPVLTRAQRALQENILECRNPVQPVSFREDGV